MAARLNEQAAGPYRMTGKLARYSAMLFEALSLVSAASLFVLVIGGAFRTELREIPPAVLFGLLLSWIIFGFLYLATVSISDEASIRMEKQSALLARSTITLFEEWVPWTWKRRATVFGSVFGLTWLFIEPLLALTGKRIPWPIWAYGALFFSSALLTFLAERTIRSRTLGGVEFVTLAVTLTQAGRKVTVETPWDLQVGRFVELLLSELGKRAIISSQIHSLYDHSLCTRSDDKYIVFENKITLRDAGLNPGDEVRLRGYIRIEHIAMLASSSYARYLGAVEGERRRGRVFIDEDVRQKALMLRNRRGSIATVYVVDSSSSTTGENEEKNGRLEVLKTRLQHEGWIEMQ